MRLSRFDLVPAPAKPINMEALRELANLSAKNAINQHARRTLIRAMYGKLTVVAVAFVASVGLFWQWSQYGACEMTFYSSLLAIVVALFWGLEYAYLTGRLIIKKSGHINIDWHGSSRRESIAGSPDSDNATEQPTASTLRDNGGDSRSPPRRRVVVG